MNNKVKISERNKDDMKKSIKEYFLKEREEDLGDLASQLVLDFFLEKLAPHVYNQGVDDAHIYIKDKLEDLFALHIGR